MLPQEPPFDSSARLLGWMSHDPAVMSETQTRRWVSQHGQLIRQAEQAEVTALQERSDLAGLTAQLQPASEPRRPAALGGGTEPGGRNRPGSGRPAAA
ncbi:MAG: hypothetical protein HS114_17105 [Anaerolineales bacterium]|nr:hypothetical protein [Anaerolineales bacterium]